MSVTQRVMTTGDWSVNLDPRTPRTTMERIRVSNRGVGFGTFLVTPTHINPNDYTDVEMLQQGRFAGVYRHQTEQFELSGPGIEMWISDEDGKGRAYGNSGLGSSTSAGLASWIINRLLPGMPWITAGSVTDVVPGSYGKIYRRVTPREVLNEICDIFNAEWRLNTDFTLDVGPVANLWPATPRTVIVPKIGDGGRDFNVRGIVGNMQVEVDLEDWVSRAIVFWDTDNSTHIRPSALVAADVPYRGPDGKYAYIESIDTAGSDTETGGAVDSLADAAYRKGEFARTELRVSSLEYDIGMDLEVGEYTWIFDPERGLYDLANPLPYRGEIIYPMKIRAMGQTWAIRNGMGVYLRVWSDNDTDTWDPVWIDLTPYVVWEDGDTEIEVGAVPRPSRK